jgi:diguanylate cyclase (GGDEF)-like protein/PAS domain S-box-containing protein
VYRDVTAQREAEASQAQLVAARERADAARRASEARFRAAFESAALGVTILDEQGVILEVNAAFAEFVGYTPAELTGRFAPELSPPEDAAVTRGPVAELRAGVRHSVSVEKRFLHRGGEVRWAMLTLSLLPLGDGRVGLVGLTTDVTDRRRAEAARRESEARFEAALDGGRFGFAALAPVRAADGAVTDFEMLSVNAQYAALLGMPAEDVVGHRLGELLPLARTDGHLARYARVLATGEPIVDEFETRDPRITAQWLRVQVVPLRDMNGDGVADGLALMVRDVTWERRVERELRLVLGVTRALTAVSDVRAATADALAALCTAVGIEYGEVWLTSDGAASAAGSAGAPVLVHGPVWHAPDDERLARFAEASGAFRFARAQGLPGTAWDLGEPVVTESLDALGDRFSREAIAHDAGLRAGAAVPVLADGEVVAVLVFLTRTARRLEHARVELLAAVAAQIGFAVRSKLATAALRDSEARLSLIYESASDLMCLMEVRHDAAGGPPTFRCESVNEAYLAVTGLERGAVVGRTVEEVLPPAAAAFVLAKYAAAVASGDTQRYEEVVELPTGTLVLDTTLNPILDEAGRCTHLLGAARDVTGRRQAEAALRHSEARFRGVLETVRSVAVTLDLDGRVTFANDALLRLTGWSREETVGCDWFARFVPAGLETAAVFREAVVGGALPAHYENEILTRGGDRRLIAWDNTLLRDGSGVITGTASIGRDVTAQRALETRLAALSEHDELTGLLNRRGFRRMADQLLKMQRREPRRSAVLYVDLDGFKPINDTHGHAEGDRALRAVAELLQSSVRDGDLVARVGGDEFAVFATGLGERGGGELLAARLRARMDEHNERARTAGRPYAIRFSVGVADHEADDTLDTLLARADAALYARKLARRG